MRYRVIGLAVLGGLLLASSVLAKPYDPERSAPQGDNQWRGQCGNGPCMHQQEMMKHRQMARELRHEARMHRRMARMHARGCCPEQFGPGMGFGGPMGPEMRHEMRRERRHAMQQEMFGTPGMNPDFPMAPPPFARERMQLRQEQFGPQMNPDRPMGPPPQHMRFRDGMKHPRAQ